jgi:transcriptional regulator with XRE-family HTH domain
MTLRETIIEFRIKHDLSQRQFANLCGLSNGYIAMIEANENPSTGKPIVPSLVSVKKMATAMGVTVQSLLEMIENETVSFDSSELTADEKELLGNFRSLGVNEKALILALERALNK